MKTWILKFIILSVITAGVSAHASEENEPVACAAELSSEQLRLINETIFHEELLPELQLMESKGLNLNFLSGLVVPEGYAANEANFQRSRAKALNELLPLIKKLEDEMAFMEPFEARLKRMARRYDESTDKFERAAILATMNNIFSIPVEHHYINLIANGAYSKDLRASLSRILRLRFNNDTTWIGPLDDAMKKGQVSYED